jgi:hypothetical protein
MSGCPVSEELHTFVFSNDFNSLVRDKILLKAVSSEQTAVSQDTESKIKQIGDIQKSIIHDNPHVEKRN